MGNGLKKASEIISPPSSPIPHRPKRKKATPTPKEVSPPSSPKAEDVSPKKRGRSTSRTRKSPSTKVNSGKKATPDRKSASPKKRKRKKDSEIKKPVNDEKSDSNDQNPPSAEKREQKRSKGKRTKNPTVATPSLEPTAIVVENEDVATMDQAGQEVNSTGSTQPPSTKKKTAKKEYPVTLDAQVHRLRHMGYLPGSVSAFTPNSTDDGQVVVARTDGSYELKSIASSKHRLITIAETAPITGRKAAVENLDDDSHMEEDDDDGVPEPCPDAASSLCWIYPTSTPICVGSGPNGNLWIVDFKQSRPVDVVSSGGGGIFDLAACKFHGAATSGSNSLPFVAGACEDGSVRIWRVTTGSSGQGEIQDPPLATLPSAGAPVLSLAWKNVAVRKQGRTTTFHTVVFAAVADGTIRKYGLDIDEQSRGIDDFSGRRNSGKETDTHNNHYTIPNAPKSILRMTIENKGRKDPTKVWSLLLLEDNTLVVGTSLGQVQFWNGETGTLTQTVIQSNSQADVLKIVVNSDETKLFCSGVDSRVVCLERKKPPIITAKPASQSELTALVTSHLNTYRPWKMTISQRPHTHDVKAMAIVTSSSNALSSSIETLLTGGLDTKICSYSVSTFAHAQPQTWYPWPSATSLFSSTKTSTRKFKRKVVSMQHHDRIELYQLENLTSNPKASRSTYLKEDVAKYPKSIPLGTIRLGGSDDDEDDDDMISSFSSPLQASALSPDGKFLAVSNASSTYLFHLKYVAGNTNDAGSTTFQPEKVELPGALQNVSATTFLFSRDELYIGDSSGDQKVHILHLSDKVKEDNEDQMDVEGEEDDAKLSMQTVSLPESQESTIAEEIVLPIQSIHADGEFMVTCSHSRENAVQIFRRSSKKASYEHFWTLPSLGGGADARPAAVALLDGKRLAVATYRSHLYLLDLETQSLNEWSEQYGFPIREKKWTEDSLCGRGYPLRLIPLQDGRLVMTSFGTFCIIDLTKPIPRRCRRVPRRPVWKNRRKLKPIVHNDDGDDGDDNDDHWLEPRVTKVVEDEYSHNDPDAGDDDVTENNHTLASPSASNSHVIPVPEEIQDEELISRSCTICSHYKNMLYTDFVSPKEMIVVEQPWSEIVETFPAALQRRIYGAD